MEQPAGLASIHAPARGATITRPMKSGGTTGLQSTLPHGERQIQFIAQTRGHTLQSTLPHGERPEADGPGGCREALQSTLPHGERQKFPGRPQNRMRLQSTLPHGERQMGLASCCVGLSFNPRSRTGSDSPKRSRPILERLASIHAPARGATSPLPVSQTVNPLQSTLPHGERPMRDRQERQGNPASIHAPARGATPPARSSDSQRSSFNPRSRTGSDGPQEGGRSWKWRFNPRSRTGSDESVRDRQTAIHGLQSTLPHGERPPGRQFRALAPAASIHAPARGATSADHRCGGAWRLQSTLPHGERPITNACVRY